MSGKERRVRHFQSAVSQSHFSLRRERKMQHFMDLQANSELGESNSWLSVKEQSGAAPNTNLDRVLFNDLVEIVPLVQSLIVNPSNPFHCNAKKRDFFLKFYLSARGKGNKTTTWEMGIMYFGLYCVGFVCWQHTERKASDLWFFLFLFYADLVITDALEFQFNYLQYYVLFNYD